MLQTEWMEIEALLGELLSGQLKKMEECAEQLVPGVTSEDLLQPNDFPELEEHPIFRYEEGVVEGIRTVSAALRAWKARH